MVIPHLFIWLLFTPITYILILSSFGGEERITFFAPARICFCAVSYVLKIPVLSTITSTLRFFHGSFSGSFSAKTRIFFFPIMMLSFVWEIFSCRVPCVESYFNKWARVLVSVKSLIATKLIFYHSNQHEEPFFQFFQNR